MEVKCSSQNGHILKDLVKGYKKTETFDFCWKDTHPLNIFSFLLGPTENNGLAFSSSMPSLNNSYITLVFAEVISEQVLYIFI